MSNQGALSGINVLDLSRLLPGPYCSMILADHGARVIAVEDKRFMADGLFMNTINRNKEHMALNLKTEEGKKIFFSLARKSDVLIEGFRPGVVDRLGVDYESVRKINPRTVYCSISGYGQNGIYRDRVGHDANYLSNAGVLNLIGEKDRPPSIPGVQIADIAGGGMNAAMGILLALFAREKSGSGQYIDISMTDGMVGFLPAVMFFQQIFGQAPERGNAMLSHGFACYNTYETADGRYLSIGAVEHRFWKKLCRHLNVPEYSDLQYDQERCQEIIDFMRTTFRQKTLAQWDAELGNQDICWAKVQSLSEVMQDPLFREREMILDFEDKDGERTPTIGVPIKLSQTPGTLRTPAVEFGGSTQDILEELGYSDDQIEKLRDDEVV